ncbi:hypothetical protein GOP47_0003770 [Adiantum capillus-veneris]|uniref:Uncharacterized protein n=1 Tax=Adiantum capillus-veneris TaxID=13818 RepID=A0A9D4ZNV8_ADICA|nr:hypothetical protein GOP47_0003770 [Adiantum capillus-veneris]
MGRLGIAMALLLFVSLHMCMCQAEEPLVGKDQREGRTEPAPPSSYFKSWNDWAQGKLGSYGKKDGETPLKQGQKASDSATAGGWSGWAFDKISSFSSRASKDVGKAAEKASQAGKDKLKAEKEAAAKEGEEMWEGAKGGAKEGSEKAKEYGGKVKEGVQDRTAKTYESGKDAGSQATQKVKEEAEL